jgi:AraC-like DNA-binding protein
MAQTVQGRARRCARWPRQPKMQRTDSNVDRVRTLVRSDRRLDLILIAEELNMNRETVRHIITDDLGMRKISTKMVPWILTDDYKQSRFHISSNFLYNAKMFDRVITGDEAWCFQYNLETKRKNMQWKTQSSPWPKKARMSRPCLYVSSITSE